MISLRRETTLLMTASFRCGAAPRPVIMARMRLLKPVCQTSATWTSRKSTSAHATKKWIVRADCCPPNAVTRKGKTEVTAGDIASPVQIISGNRTKTTAV